MPFGQRIRELRRARSWTQRQAGYALGVSTRTVIRHERRDSLRPWLPLLLKVRALEADNNMEEFSASCRSTLTERPKSVTHVSGTFCYPCLGTDKLCFHYDISTPHSWSRRPKLMTRLKRARRRTGLIFIVRRPFSSGPWRPFCEPPRDRSRSPARDS